jgi:hypothetical protein
MSTSTDPNRTITATTTRSTVAPDSCSVCRQLRLERREDALYELTPDTSGGWVQWSSAILRLVRRLGDQATHIVTIEQRSRTGRSLQLTIGHGVARLEASGNAHLTGSSRLTGVDERLLTLLGWTAPAQGGHGHPSEPSQNWTMPLDHGDWAGLVENITATIVGIFRFSGQIPVSVQVAQASRPCGSCSWPGETLAPAA